MKIFNMEKFFVFVFEASDNKKGVYLRIWVQDNTHDAYITTESGTLQYFDNTSANNTIRLANSVGPSRSITSVAQRNQLNVIGSCH